MTVSEFANMWTYHCTDTNITFMYNDKPITLFRLLSVFEELHSFKFKITVNNLQQEQLLIESNDYDLDELNVSDKQLLNSLQVYFPENTIVQNI